MIILKESMSNLINKTLRVKNFIVIFIALAVIVVSAVYLINLFRSHTAEEFNIETLHSGVDFNGNGVDDYTDIMLGARMDAENKPTYDPAYFEGGYPPDNAGVCTDVVWRAFKNAGYCLKDMVDSDIEENVGLYPRVEGKPDPNIDFRRVYNLKVYFERYGESLTTDTSEIAEWQPGDIVVFELSHIAIVSDKRNSKGVPYIIHNSGQPVREEDRMNYGTVIGHYRFDASKIPEDKLIRFE